MPYRFRQYQLTYNINTKVQLKTPHFRRFFPTLEKNQISISPKKNKKEISVNENEKRFDHRASNELSRTKQNEKTRRETGKGIILRQQVAWQSMMSTHFVSAFGRKYFLSGH